MSDEWEQRERDLTERAKALKASEGTNPNYEAEKTALKTEAVMLTIDIANKLVEALAEDSQPAHSHDITPTDDVITPRKFKIGSDIVYIDQETNLRYTGLITGRTGDGWVVSLDTVNGNVMELTDEQIDFAD